MSSFNIIRNGQPPRQTCARDYLYPDPTDKFHPAYSEAAELYKTYGKLGPNFQPTRQEHDPISRLPLEVSNLIFSYLSLTDVDSCRFTCTEWWYRIMTHIGVLSSTLFPQSPPATGNGHLDDLVKKFDKAINDPDHFSRFRMPYRLRHTEFCLPESFNSYAPSHGRTTDHFMFAHTNFHIKGNIIVFMAKSPVDMPSDPRAYKPPCLVDKLFFYKICLDSIPVYLGSLEYSSFSDRPFGILDVADDGWTIHVKVRMNKEVRSYKLRPRKSFERDGAKFEVTENRRPELLGNESSLIWDFGIGNKMMKELPEDSSKRWRTIAFLPKFECNKEEVSIEEHLEAMTPLMLGKDQKSNSNHLTVLRAVTNSHLHGLILGLPAPVSPLHPVAILSPPEEGWIFRNIAVESSYHKTGTIAIAVIWQPPDNLSAPSELYIHIVDHSIGIQPPVPCEISTCRIAGRRLRSIPRTTGGTHPSSPLWELPNPPSNTSSIELPPFDNCAHLGGLVFHAPSEDPRHGTSLPKAGPLSIWGPRLEQQEPTTTPNSFQKLSIYDFWTFVFPPDVGITQHLTHFQNVEPPQSAVKCHCELHDEHIIIQMPNPGRSPCMEKKNKLEPHFLHDRAIDKVGTWECVDSPKRKAARERFTQILEERIKMIIADVEADGEAANVEAMVSDIWDCATWSAKGEILKPDGWKRFVTTKSFSKKKVEHTSKWKFSPF